MPPAAGCPNSPACALEPHAQQLPEGGDGEGERAPRLGGAVPGAPADDGAPHPGGKQVVAGPMPEGEEPGAGGRSQGGRTPQAAGKGEHPHWPGSRAVADCPEA